MSSIPITGERELTVADKLRLALDLGEAGLDVMREKLRREDPDASDGEIHARLVAWFQDRPAATHGDAEGRPATSRFFCS